MVKMQACRIFRVLVAISGLLFLTTDGSGIEGGPEGDEPVLIDPDSHMYQFNGDIHTGKWIEKQEPIEFRGEISGNFVPDDPAAYHNELEEGQSLEAEGRFSGLLDVNDLTHGDTEPRVNLKVEFLTLQGFRKLVDFKGTLEGVIKIDKALSKKLAAVAHNYIEMDGSVQRHADKIKIEGTIRGRLSMIGTDEEAESGQ